MWQTAIKMWQMALLQNTKKDVSNQNYDKWGKRKIKNAWSQSDHIYI